MRPFNREPTVSTQPVGIESLVAKTAGVGEQSGSSWRSDAPVWRAVLLHVFHIGKYGGWSDTGRLVRARFRLEARQSDVWCTTRACQSPVAPSVGNLSDSATVLFGVLKVKPAQNTERRQDMPPGTSDQPASKVRRTAIICFSLVLAAATFVFAARGFGRGADVVGPAADAPPPQSKIAFTMGDPGRIYVADPDGSNAQQITTGHEEGSFAKDYGYAHDSYITWSPDGTTIAFMRWYDGPAGSITSLCSVGIDGRDFRVIVRDFNGGQLSWSPDGTTLAYYGGGDETIHLINHDGSDDRTLPGVPARVMGDPPSWLADFSPDGTTIAFTTRDLWTIGVDGSGLRQITHLAGDAAAFGAAWSPDGSRIAFSLGRWVSDGGTGGFQTGGDINVVNRDGSALTSLTGTARSADLPSPPLDSTGSPSWQEGWTSPTWSPDGSQIALSGWSPRGAGIYLMNADGSDRHEILAPLEGGGGEPRWHTVSLTLDPPIRTDTEHGFTVSYPEGWTPATEILTPALTDPREILALATYPLRPDGVNCAQLPVNAIEDLRPTDALVWLAEREQGATEVTRPPDFETWASEAEPDVSPDCLATPKDFIHVYGEFSDAGRVFDLYVAYGRSASVVTLSELWTILNSLTFDPASPSARARTVPSLKSRFLASPTFSTVAMSSAYAR